MVSQRKEAIHMDELVLQMNKTIKATRESSQVIGNALKSILKRLNEGGK